MLRKEQLKLIKITSSAEKTSRKSTCKGTFSFEGLGRAEVDKVECGDLCAIIGIDNFDIGDTIASVMILNR